jgi:CMP-N-acetylneuraminic acid synthetase
VYLRPPELATDEALVIDAIRHLIGVLRSEGEPSQVMVLLEPTCPLRSSQDIQQCIRQLAADNLDSVATFKPADLNPHRAWRIVDGKPSPFVSGADPWQPRQKQPSAFQLTGAVYAFRADRLPGDTNALLYGRTGAVITTPVKEAVSKPCSEDLPLTSAITRFFVNEDVTLKAAMQQLEETEERILFVIDQDGKLFGSVTDGDIRRWILATDSLEGCVREVCNRCPYTVATIYKIEDVRRVMLERNIACIPVLDEDRRIVDLLFWGKIFKALSVDIDNESDFIMAQALLAHGAW